VCPNASGAGALNQIKPRRRSRSAVRWSTASPRRCRRHLRRR
jgi:hypothetical protein